MSSPSNARRQNPYQGLVPFTEADRPYFFGRETERRIVAGHLLGSRLTLLYGESGVGKTSLLRAGVVPDVRAEAQLRYRQASRREFTVAYCSEWRDDAGHALLEAVREGARATWGDLLDAAPVASSLGVTLRSWTATLGGDIVLILDQFEEYFLYHPFVGTSTSFVTELAGAINDLDLDVNVLLSLREDSLAKLDPFKPLVPQLFDNRVRLEHLTRDEARHAIVEPLGAWNERERPSPPYTIEQGLADEILDELAAGAYADVWSRRATAPAPAGTASSIEAPYLQLVMERLWEDAPSAHTLELARFRALGGAAQIARRHLANIMARLPQDDQDTAAQALQYLVTSSGTKMALTAADVARWSALPADKIELVLAALAARDARILRRVEGPAGNTGVAFYEIFHDLLGEAIASWSASYLWRAQRPWGYLRALSTGEVHPMADHWVSIGRSVEWVHHQIDLRYQPVSRLHVMITSRLGIVEMRSKFGTTVNASFVTYGRPRELKADDLIVLAGVVPMSVGVLKYTPADEAALRVPLPEPSPPVGWALLIDGLNRTVTPLDAAEHYLRLDEHNRILVGRESDPSAFLRVTRGRHDLEFEAVGLVEGIAVEIKHSDREEPVAVAWERGQPLPPWQAELDADVSYSGVIGLYREVRFQIVPVIAEP
jgi:hypothetical protein